MRVDNSYEAASVDLMPAWKNGPPVRSEGLQAHRAFPARLLTRRVGVHLIESMTNVPMEVFVCAVIAFAWAGPCSIEILTGRLMDRLRVAQLRRAFDPPSAYRACRRKLLVENELEKALEVHPVTTSKDAVLSLPFMIAGDATAADRTERSWLRRGGSWKCSSEYFDHPFFRFIRWIAYRTRFHGG